MWTKEDVEKTFQGSGFSVEERKMISDYFSVNENGYWEHDNYILLRKESDDVISKRYKISVEELNGIISKTKKVLLAGREKRIKPGLDDKSLTSWNALMIDALCESHRAFNDKHFLSLAEKNAELLFSKQLKQDGSLFHSYKSGKSTINGFLEDSSGIKTF